MFLYVSTASPCPPLPPSEHNQHHGAFYITKRTVIQHPLHPPVNVFVMMPLSHNSLVGGHSPLPDTVWHGRSSGALDVLRLQLTAERAAST